MRKFFLAAALVLSASLSFAQDVQLIPLAIAWDMDELGLDVDYNVLASQIVDSKSDYTISAQNEVCRVNTVTIVDADSSITAGVITVTGTDCWGDALVCVTPAITDGSGTKTLSVSSGTSDICAFKTITQVSNGVMTGEGGAGDTLSVGYGALSGYQFPIYGIRKTQRGVRYVDPFAFGEPAGTMKINGTAVTSFASVDGGAFHNLSQFDLVYIFIDGVAYERRLVAVASDDAATLDSALPTAVAPATSAEVRFKYKNRFIFRDDKDAWIPLPKGGEASFIVFDVDANVNTGGVVSSVECAVYANGVYNPVVQVDTDTVASAATGTPTTSIDLRLAPYTHCRVGAKFGTGDDADTANEDINIFMLNSKRN
jgi:hypothetical protein